MLHINIRHAPAAILDNYFSITFYPFRITSKAPHLLQVCRFKLQENGLFQMKMFDDFNVNFVKIFSTVPQVSESQINFKVNLFLLLNYGGLI